MQLSLEGKGKRVISSDQPEERLWRACFKQEEHVVTREIIGETILVPIRGKLADMQKVFTLNEVGAYIWSHLDGQRTLKEICQGLETNYNVDREQAKRDLNEFISELVHAELVVGDM